MLYIKAFCGNYYHRSAYTATVTRKRKRIYVALKKVFGFPLVKD